MAGTRRNKSIKLAFALLLILVAMFMIGWSWLIYSDSVNVSFFLEQSKNIGLGSPVVVDFSGSMIPQSLRENISIIPSHEVSLRWEDHNRKLVVSPIRKWTPETGYQIHINGIRNIFLMKANGSVEFRSESRPQIAGFIPSKGAEDVVLDIEDPIQATFDRPLEEYKVKFTIDPFIELESQIDFKEKKIVLIPKEALEKGREYSISVFIKGLEEKDDAYRLIHQSSFRTKPEAPKVWERDFSLRIDQAKRYTEARIQNGKYIDINLRSQVLAIFEDGRVLDAYIISSGRRGMETPQGTFRIANKFPRAWSDKYKLFMPYWMAFVSSGDYGIHELPEWPGGYKEGANHLGIPVSHGCVRLGVGSAERVYNWAEVGTPVEIHY